jgi:hypothetical protein
MHEYMHNRGDASGGPGRGLGLKSFRIPGYTGAGNLQKECCTNIISNGM